MNDEQKLEIYNQVFAAVYASECVKQELYESYQGDIILNKTDEKMNNISKYAADAAIEAVAHRIAHETFILHNIDLAVKYLER